MLYSIKQFRRISCGLTAAVLVMATQRAQGAVIQAVGSNAAPVFNTDSVFDVGHIGNAYTVASGTTLSPGGYDVRDLFGGSYGTAGEQNDVLFSNGHLQGTVDAVNVTLAASESLKSFNLFLADDGNNGDRSAREFKLFAGGKLIDDVPILNTYGNESYTSVYGGNTIDVSDTLKGSPMTSDYTLELIQNQGLSGSSGIRAQEFEAFGGGTPSGSGGYNAGSSSVPEPASMGIVLLSGVLLLGRRRRT